MLLIRGCFVELLIGVCTLIIGVSGLRRNGEGSRERKKGGAGEGVGMTIKIGAKKGGFPPSFLYVPLYSDIFVYFSILVPYREIGKERGNELYISLPHNPP